MDTPIDLTIVCSLLIAYGLGSIPFGLLVSRFYFGIDIRQHGSKNIGATNVFRVIGKRAGLGVLALDALKGYLAVFLPQVFLMGSAARFPLLLSLGVAAILGHTFPVWLRFKGGKGVATSLGVFIALTWLPTLIAFLVWCLLFSVFRIVSVASIAAALSFPPILAIFERRNPYFLWLLAISLVLLVFILFTHRANISRLLRGEEKKLI